MTHFLTCYKLQQPYIDEAYSVYGLPSWDNEFGTAGWADEVHSETILCPAHPEHQRAGKRIGNLVVVLPSEKVGDFVWTWFSDCLITDKVLRQFRKAGFTGFEVNPVVVKPKTEKGKKLVKLPVLWELVVTGSGGDAHPSSGIRRIYTCPHCNMIRYSSFKNGILVDKQTWDGSDFFTVTGYPNSRLVTEKVKNFVIEQGFTNCALIRSQDLVWKSLSKPEDTFEDK